MLSDSILEDSSSQVLMNGHLYQNEAQDSHVPLHPIASFSEILNELVLISQPKQCIYLKVLTLKYEDAKLKELVIANWV